MYARPFRATPGVYCVTIPAMGRPPKDRSGPAGETLTIRLTADDRALLDELVAAKAAELADDAVEVTATSYIRAIIRREARLLKGAKPEQAAPVSDLKPAQVRTMLERALKAGRSQAEIAKAAGFDTSRLSRFKSGKGLSPESLSRLAAALK